jgi:hypothetical protein
MSMLLYHLNKAATSGNYVEENCPILTPQEIDEILNRLQIETKNQTQNQLYK